MNLEEVGRLLGMIAAFDGRTSGHTELHAWNEIAQRGRWTYDEARAQVLSYFEGDQGERWLMPGRLNTMIRARRQDEMARSAAPQGEVGQPAIDATRDRAAIAALWEASKVEQRRVREERVRLVLAHPDLAEQLTSRLIGYIRPQDWTGYIPPAEIPGSETSPGYYVLNPSPRRAALVALVEEARRREGAGQSEGAA